MARLIAQSPTNGQHPITIGTATLSESEAAPLTSIAPFAGAQEALEKALKAEHGLDWPAPCHTTSNTSAGARLVWAGMDLAFLTGVQSSAKLGKHAALSDQSDAWAMLKLQGKDASAVLARLVPADLRESQFKPRQTLRSTLGHMQLILVKESADEYSLMVFRSMARTALHELTEAMTAVAKRAAM